MDAFIDTLTILGVFFLRLGVPILLVIGVGYLLRQLDARWEAEAWAQKEAQTAARPVIHIEKRPAPSIWPSPTALPASLVGAFPTALDVFGQSCWEMKNCAPSTREQCPAYQQPGSPCWLAHQQAEGQIPEPCYNCHIFAVTQQPIQPQLLELWH